MADFTDSITVRGEDYDFDPNEMLAQVPCENCGHTNEVECSKEGDDIVFYGFACENCGHWNSADE